MTLAELMARYCDGDAAAFSELYDRAAPQIFAELIAATSDRARAAAALEQAFLRLHEARSAYVKGADPLPWIRALARQSIRRISERATQGRIGLSYGR